MRGPRPARETDHLAMPSANSTTTSSTQARNTPSVNAKQYRGQGVGGQSIEGLHQELCGIDVVSVFCHSSLSEFYSRTGYTFTSQSVGHRTTTGRS